MRQIKFRGKRLENGEWVYGSLVSIHDTAIIVEDCDFSWNPDTDITAFWFDKKENEVDPATVGQYTGLKDKNGKEIYEGDVLRWFVNDLISTAPVEYRDGAFWMVRDINTGHGVWNDWLRGEYEIFGNIHDNPELLKTE